MKNCFIHYLLTYAGILFLFSCGGDEEPTIDCSASGLTVSVSSTTDVFCTTPGTIVALASGGSGSVQYSMDGTTFQSSGTFSGVSTGSFTITVKDANDCTATASATVGEDTGDVAVTVTETTAETCTDGGSLTASASGGTGTLEYSVDGTTFQSGGTFSGLVAGNYTVTAKDANGCTGNTTATVGSDMSTVTFSTSKEDAGCGTSNGSISVTASGGDGSYTYKFGSGAFGTSNQASSLAAGEHTVVVKDGSGCETTESVSVLSGTSYANSVKTIIDTKCAISGCHISGTGRQNFSTFATVQNNAAGIKTRTQSGDMPRSGSLTADEKALIACWVDDGALNN